MSQNKTKEEILRVRPELIGIHSMNPFITNMSSSRSVMFSSHLSQALVINNSEEPIVQSGVEREMGKYTFFAGPDCDCRVLRVIDRYRKGHEFDSINFSPEKIVVYENTETSEIGYFSIPYFKSMHQHFGFKYEKTDNYSRLLPGMYLNKDLAIADSPNKKENGGYGLGVNLNMCLMSKAGVAEDGYIISESAAKKLSFKLFEKRSIEFGNKKFPLNLYGDENNYKIMPDIGEYVHESGILMALREHDNTIAPVALGVRDTMDIDVVFDDCTYVREGKGKVVDIKVHHNPGNSTNSLLGTTKDLDKYISGLKSFYEELLLVEKTIADDRLNKYGSTDMKLEPSFHRLLTEAHSNIDKDYGEAANKRSNRVTKTFRGDIMDEYKIDFVIEYEINEVNVGYKIVGLYGDKGVITSIVPDEQMPVDKEGRRADIIGDDNSTTSRMNIGRLYSQYFNHASDTVANMVRNILNTEKMSKENASKLLSNTKENVINEAFNLLLEYYQITSKSQFKHYSAVSRDLNKVKLILEEVVSDTAFLFIKIGESGANGRAVEYDRIVEKLEKSKFKPLKDHVTFLDENGNLKTSVEKMRIAPMYILLLEKIADNWLSISSAKTNHFGVLSSIVKADKSKAPWRASPVRTISETEGRLMAAYTGSEAISEIMDQSTNAETHKMVYKKMLTSDKPTNIEKMIDRDKHPFGKSKPLQILDHITTCAGFKIVYEPEK